MSSKTSFFLYSQWNTTETVMPANKDPRTDTYISNSANFAQPILKHIRQLVHKACPEVKETIKWGFPHFEYKGPICHMASSKLHCTFGF